MSKAMFNLGHLVSLSNIRLNIMLQYNIF